MSEINITFNRSDGTERAKFDNFEDAIIFSELMLKKQIEGNKNE